MEVGEPVFEGDPDYVPTQEAPLVYHLLGSDEEMESLVLTRDNYLEYYPILLSEALKHLAAEAEALSAKAYFCKSTHNAYLTEENGLDGDDETSEQTDRTWGTPLTFTAPTPGEVAAGLAATPAP